MATIDTTKLKAVNTMLSYIGEEPVNSLTTTPSAEVVLAEQVLDEINEKVQSRGWIWNTDLDIELTPDANGRYAWQDGWMAFDVDRSRYPRTDVVKRGGYLHNRIGGTNVFTESTLKGSVTVYLDWTDLPEVARKYILTRAARTLHDLVIGDESRHQYSRRDEEEAWSDLMAHEIRQGDYNILRGGDAGAAATRWTGA